MSAQQNGKGDLRKKHYCLNGKDGSTYENGGHDEKSSLSMHLQFCVPQYEGY